MLTRPMVATRITDGTLLLRLPEERDLEAMVAACQDPEIPRWTLGPSPYTWADAEAWLPHARETAAAGTALHLVVLDADDEALLGSVGFVELDRVERHGEIGYWLAAHARGRGVMVRAVELLRQHGVRELGLRRIEMHVHPDNAASARVAERAGFATTGERHLPDRCAAVTGDAHVVYRWSSAP